MMEHRENERGAIMVEVLAVLALLGTMGTLLFRQVIQRNQELDSINMATEMRILKEGFLAYINADKAVFETSCVVGDDDPRKCSSSDQLRAQIRFFVPDGYADFNGNPDILDMYHFFLYGYRVSGRKYFYGIIVPKTGADGPLPEAMKLTQAARVANLIGSDGGIYSGDGTLDGTMGGWSLPCDGSDMCPTLSGGMTGIPVVLTGIDVYVPEPDIKNEPRIPVAVPESIAFRRLHSSEYFSVGNSNDNCIQLCDEEGNPDPNGTELCHTFLNAENRSQGDTIYGPGTVKTGTDKCDPLFWVGTVTNTDTDKSSAGHVYIKKNLYVGRDNENNRQAVAIETDSESDASRQIRVYNIDGTERLTLNAAGQVIARDSNGGETVRIDGGNGIITTYERKYIDGDIKQNVYLPTLRIGGGQILSNEQVTLADGTKTSYKLDLANVSLLNDVRLTARGGAKLSEILPNYIAKDIQSLSFSAGGNTEEVVPKPECPQGYSRAIVVTPTKWSQYIQGAELNLTYTYNGNDRYEGRTESGVGTGSHNHTFYVNAPDAHNVNASMISAENNSITLKDNDTTPQIRLIQKAPVQIALDSDDKSWTVRMTYGETAPTESGIDDITALAQTYCVFEKDAFQSGGSSWGNTENNNGLYREPGEAPDSNTSLTPDTSDREDYIGTEEETTTKCVDDWTCLNTESCEAGYCVQMDQSLCTGKEQGIGIGDNLYCVDGSPIRLCFYDEVCGSKRCVYNKCI